MRTIGLGCRHASEFIVVATPRAPMGTRRGWLYPMQIIAPDGHDAKARMDERTAKRQCRVMRMVMPPSRVSTDMDASNGAYTDPS